MSPLEQAILKTIVYFDLFDFAPTLNELERWLLRPQFTVLVSTSTPVSPEQLLHAVERLPQVNNYEGCYFLRGREDLAAKRRSKYDWTEKKIKRARWLLRLIAIMPHVRGVWLTNAAGWRNAHRDSDLDLFIITTPHRVWTARFFTTALLKMLQQRPGEQSAAKAICLSMYLSVNNLNLQPYQLNTSDIHFAFWVNQVYPLYDATSRDPNRGAYQQYQQANKWLVEFFVRPQWTQSIERAWVRQSVVEKILKKILEKLPLEKILKKIQLKILPTTLRAAANANTSTNVVMNDQILKLHTNDSRARVQDEWQKSCSKIICT